MLFSGVCSVALCLLICVCVVLGRVVCLLFCVCFVFRGLYCFVCALIRYVLFALVLLRCVVAVSLFCVPIVCVELS